MKSRAFLYLLAGLSLSCALLLLCGYMPDYTMGIINLFVPAFAVLAYWGAMHRFNEHHCAERKDAHLPSLYNTAWEGEPIVATRRDDVYEGPNRSKVVHIICAYCIFALVMGIVLRFPDGVPRELPQSARSLHRLFIITALCSIAVWVLIRGRQFRFPTVWYFENALLAVAIILLIGDGEDQHISATALVLTAESFFYSFTFFTSYDLGRHMRRPAMFMLGVMYGGTQLCMGIGRLLSFYVTDLPGGALAMAVIMSVLVVVELILAPLPTMFEHGVPLFKDVARDAQEVKARVSTDPNFISVDGAPTSRVPAKETPGFAQSPSEVAILAPSTGKTAAAATRQTDGQATCPAPYHVRDAAPAAIPAIGGLTQGVVDEMVSPHQTGAPATERAFAGAMASADDPVKRLGWLRVNYGLTAAETRIAGLIARGRTRAFIACDLGYSENTIRNYTRTLYQKVGIHSKQELIDLFSAQGNPSELP